jgi:hypothetical protein
MDIEKTRRFSRLDGEHAGDFRGSENPFGESVMT